MRTNSAAGSITDAIARFANRRAAAVVVVLWSFAEAIVLPVVPDVLLDLLALAAPRRAVPLFLVSVAGSVLGTVVLFAIASSNPAAATGLVLGVPLVDPSMLDAAVVAVAGGDPLSIAQFGPGTPLKVDTVAWALGPATLGPLLVGAVLNRLTRVFPALFAAAAVGWVAPGWLRRHERLVLSLYGIGWIAIYAVLAAGAR